MDSPATPALVRRIAAGVAAGFTSAAVTHFICLFVFFLASAANPEAFRQLNDYFLPSSLLLFVLLSLIAVFDGLRRWYIAIPAALVAAVLAAFAGTTIALGATGVVLDAVALEFVARSLAGPNLAFIIFATLVTATLGRRVWSLIAGGKLDSPRIRDRRVALVRLPAGNLADGIVTHQARVGIDTDLADRQWDEYVSALDEHGWDTVEVPVAPDAADSVFIEDTVVMFGDLAVVTSPGAESRRGETAAVEETVRELGLRVERIELPGTPRGRRCPQGRQDRVRRAKRANQRRRHPAAARPGEPPRLHGRRGARVQGAAPEDRGHRPAGWDSHRLRAERG